MLLATCSRSTKMTQKIGGTMDQKFVKWLNISYTHLAADSSEVACSRGFHAKTQDAGRDQHELGWTLQV